jgi:hypothetical protein
MKKRWFILQWFGEDTEFEVACDPLGYESPEEAQEDARMACKDIGGYYTVVEAIWGVEVKDVSERAL